MKYWLLLSLVFVGLSACQRQTSEDIKETRFLLGTVVEFTVAGVDKDVGLRAIQQAALVMQKVENTFTTHGDISNTVKKINQAKIGEEVTLAPSVDALLLQSIAIQKNTRGAFDPTLGDLNQRWGFSSENAPTTPLSLDVVQQALAHSGVQYIQRISSHVWIKEKVNVKLDFGAIAKGLAIDEGLNKLQDMGIEHAIINAGGDMRILGNHIDKPWRIAIRHPRKEEALGWLEVNQDISIVTSGDYERFFLYKGKRYHHIIDPQTGYPSSSSMSVTVSAPTATQADALSTAMFILGHEKGMGMIEKMKNVEAIWVDAQQKIHMSSGMESQFHLSQSYRVGH